MAGHYAYCDLPTEQEIHIGVVTSFSAVLPSDLKTVDVINAASRLWASSQDFTILITQNWFQTLLGLVEMCDTMEPLSSESGYD